MKSLKAKQGKSAPAVRSVARTAVRAKSQKQELTAEEVAVFERQLALHQQAENAWQRLASPPDGDDRWSELEEHLLYKSESRGNAERRWKYFSK